MAFLFESFQRLRRRPESDNKVQPQAVSFEPTEEEIAEREKKHEDYWQRKERERNEILERRIALLKEIDPALRGFLEEMNASKLHGLGKITVDHEIDEIRTPESLGEAMVYELEFKKVITYYTLEWRDKETSYNGFCVAVRINDEELEKKDPSLFLNLRQRHIFGGDYAGKLKEKWPERLEKLKAMIVDAIEDGRTTDWRRVPERVKKTSVSPEPYLGYTPIRESKGEVKEQRYPFPEKCESCGAPLSKLSLREAYSQHKSVIDCGHCGTPVHRLLQKALQ